MKVGFSGTKEILTEEQKVILEEMLENLPVDEFHHGDCVGADAIAHNIAILQARTVIIHPPKNRVKRAYCKGDEIREPKEYLSRNWDIANECELLIACPKEATEQLRSGTWSTVRYARKLGKMICIILPSGHIVREGA